MARALLTVSSVMRKNRVKKYSIMSGNELKRLIAESEIAPAVAKETNELFKRRAGELAGRRRQPPKITVSRKRKPNSLSRFGKTAGTGASMTSEAPDVRQKYEVMADMYFRIVARTPYDEDYKYTVPNPHRNKKGYRYITDRSTGKRKVVPYAPYVREHRADDVVARNEWKLTLRNADGTSVSFHPSDFSVSFESTTNRTAYKSIAKRLREMNMSGTEAKDFVSGEITNENPYIDVLEYGRYSKKVPTESHKGPGNKREHGSIGGYSVQAPRGMVRVTLAEFNSAQEAAEAEGRQVSVSDVGFSMKIPGGRSNKILAEAMSGITEFVSEKDILNSFMRGLPKVPLSGRTTQEIRRKYISAARKRIESEDRELMEQLADKVQKETKDEQAAVTEDRRRMWREKQRRYRARKKGLLVSVTTPNSRSTVQPIRERLSDLRQESSGHVVRGIVTVTYEDEGDSYEAECTISKGKVFLNYPGNAPMPADKFLTYINGYSEEALEKLIEGTFSRIPDGGTR